MTLRLTLSGIPKFLSLAFLEADWNNRSGKTYRDWKPATALKGRDQFLGNDH
ncbi:MAG TPA: hypothetical protein VMU57_07535 [Edaphobacter sp.]|uniref:hypothetical protein n=1 Tax=Edaphobacter sp. TaxID=1934404 RepID=UPI002CD8A962|nr:hypothetical protein [Edaphobacter sp.]HUZ94750.1 hypothetical protein [Edaphobacter sp.]